MECVLDGVLLKGTENAVDCEDFVLDCELEEACWCSRVSLTRPV